MRKQVRLGLLVGGVILAALVLVLVFGPSNSAAPTRPGVVVAPPATPSMPTDALANAGNPPTTTAEDPFARTSAPASRWDMLDSSPLMTQTPETANHTTDAPADPPVIIDVPRRDVPVSADAVALATPVREAESRGESATPVRTEPTRVETPVRASTPATPATSKTYTVQSGDTLSRIASEFYGSAHLHPYILQANPGINPRNLKLGSTLVIPDISTVKSPSPNEVAVVRTEEAYNPATAYKVRQGDSLYTISIRLYGTPKKVDEIYSANKDVIGADADRLRLGMLLKLPSPPTHLKAE